MKKYKIIHNLERFFYWMLYVSVYLFLLSSILMIATDFTRVAQYGLIAAFASFVIGMIGVAITEEFLKNN